MKRLLDVFVAVAVAVAVAVLVAYCRHSIVWIEPSSVDRLVDIRWFTTSRVENRSEAPETIQIIIWKSGLRFNPLCPTGDQHQLSPNNICTLSRDRVMRINKVIT